MNILLFDFGEHSSEMNVLPVKPRSGARMQPTGASRGCSSQETELAPEGRKKRIIGAIEGTRTPTPLPVHGPEPCASANSATMASGLTLQRRPQGHRNRKTYIFILPPPSPVSNSPHLSVMALSESHYHDGHEVTRRKNVQIRPLRDTTCPGGSWFFIFQPDRAVEILNWELPKAGSPKPPYPSFAFIVIFAFSTFDTGHPFSAASAYF